MDALNIFELTRIEDIDYFNKYEKFLSRRNELGKTKEHERKSLLLLVNTLLQETDISAANLDHFYFAFSIPQISKEFDLLRINANLVLNIEIKSSNVGEEKIKRQLLQNQYYLRYLSRKVLLFTYVADMGIVYELSPNGEISQTSICALALAIQDQTRCLHGNIDTLFRASNFLVSPLNNPDKFLAKEYFLTSQQEEIKNSIIAEVVKNQKCTFFSITGSPGTGKTLLLYDLAHRCLIFGECCIIHCGILCDGHTELDKRVTGLKIYSAKDFARVDKYTQPTFRFVFLDESHRIYANQFSDLIDYAKRFDLVCVFSHDSTQILSKRERQADIAQSICSLPQVKEYSLSGKIRTNKELASFILKLIDLKRADSIQNYSSISIAYAKDENEAQEMINVYRQKSYTFINYTSSMYKHTPFDCYQGWDFNAHSVIGQEFDNILMVIDDSFRYNDEGMLIARTHPTANYLYVQMLFQGITRVREKLAIIVVGNWPLFDRLLSIVSG